MQHFFSVKVSIFLIVFIGLACKSSDNYANLQNKNSSPEIVSNTIPEFKGQITSTIPSFDKGVVLNFNIETDGTRKPKIIGETNLPDGTELMFSIEGKTVRYNGADKGTVQNGRFQSDTFSSNYNDLEVGQYLAEVLMPIAEVQTRAVRAVIGEKGENLKGSLVKKGSIGITVSAEKPFQLKLDGTIVIAEDKLEVAKAKKNAFAVFDLLKELEKQGRDMEFLRSTQTIENISQCGVLMRERQPKADDLRSKAESLPQPFSFLLTPAAIDLKLCVSCVSFAMENCDRAKKSLEEAAKEMRKNK